MGQALHDKNRITLTYDQLESISDSLGKILQHFNPNEKLEDLYARGESDDSDVDILELLD